MSKDEIEFWIEIAKSLSSPLVAVATGGVAVLVHFLSRQHDHGKERRQRRKEKVDQALNELSINSVKVRDGLGELANVAVRWAGKGQIVGPDAEQFGKSIRELTANLGAIEVVQYQLRMATCDSAALEAQAYAQNIGEAFKALFNSISAKIDRESLGLLLAAVDGGKAKVFAAIVKDFKGI